MKYKKTLLTDKDFENIYNNLKGAELIEVEVLEDSNNGFLRVTFTDIKNCKFDYLRFSQDVPDVNS